MASSIVTHRYNNVVKKTYDYTMFERLKGNRNVEPQRVDKIKKSIESVGYIPNPIIVNEKYEVIDGQGRLQACKELGLDVYYLVVEGIGMEECISMNMEQSNWKVMDFIQSYAEMGNLNYVYLLALMKRYQDYNFGFDSILRAATNGCRPVNSIIKGGKFICTENDFNKAVETLNYMAKFSDLVSQIGGRSDYVYSAIGLTYRFNGCDTDRLFKKMTDNIREFRRCGNLEDCLEELSNIYNNRLRQDSKMYFHIIYKQDESKRRQWYLSRYKKEPTYE